MRRTVLVGLGLTLPALLLAAELFSQLGWEQKAFEESCFKFVKEPDRLPSFQATPAMRALALTQRKGAVEAIGAKAKAYYGSEAFKKRWTEYRAPFTAGAEQQRQRAVSEEQIQGQIDQSMQQMEQMMAMMPPAQQAEMKKAMAKAKAEKAARAGKVKKASPEADNAPPKDPQVNLRKALQHFLAVTEGVDYGAALSHQEGRKYFADKTFEAKPAEWKMAYRAGREASEGARAYVRAWAAELK